MSRLAVVVFLFAAFSYGVHYLVATLANQGSNVEGQITVPSQTQIILQGHAGAVGSIAFSPDGRWLASSSADQTIRIWDYQKAHLLRTLRTPGGVPTAACITIDPSARLMACGGHGAIRVWSTANWKSRDIVDGMRWRVSSVALSKDGRILASGWEDRRIRYWDLTSGRLIRSTEACQPREEWGMDRGVNSLAYSLDGRLLASGSDDELVRLWEARSGRLIRVLKGSKSPPSSVVFSPDASLLVAAEHGSDTIRVWNVHTGQTHCTLKSPLRPVWSVALSPDGQILAAGMQDCIRLWSIRSTKEVSVLLNNSGCVDAVQFSPDGKWLAWTSSNKTVQIRNLHLRPMAGIGGWNRLASGILTGGGQPW